MHARRSIDPMDTHSSVIVHPSLYDSDDDSDDEHPSFLVHLPSYKKSNTSISHKRKKKQQHRHDQEIARKKMKLQSVYGPCQKCPDPGVFRGYCARHSDLTCFLSFCDLKAYHPKTELCRAHWDSKSVLGKCLEINCTNDGSCEGYCFDHIVANERPTEDAPTESPAPTRKSTPRENWTSFENFLAGKETDTPVVLEDRKSTRSSVRGDCSVIPKCFISSCRNQIYHKGSQLCRQHYQNGKHPNIGKCLAKTCHERGELEGYCLSHVDTLFRAMSSSPRRTAQRTTSQQGKAKHKRSHSHAVSNNPQRPASAPEGLGIPPKKTCPVKGCTDMGTFRGYCMLHSTLECFVSNCHRLAQSSDTELCRRHKHNSVGKCKMFGCFQPGDVEQYCSEHVISIFPSEEVEANVAHASSSKSKGHATSKAEDLEQPKATVEPPESRRIQKRTDNTQSCYYPTCSVLGSLQGYCVEHSLLECFVSSCFLKAEDPTTELCRKHHLLKCHTNQIRGKCNTPYVFFINLK